MADEAPQAAAAPATAPAPTPAAAPVATPRTDPTPAQVESRSVVKDLTSEIDGLWSQLEAPAPAPAERRAEPEPEAAAEAPAPAVQDAPPPKADAPKTEDAAPPPPAADDRAEIERQAEQRVRERIEREARAEREAAERIEAQADYQRRVAAFTGSQADYEAVERALLAANARADYSLLDALDVALPTGQKVSELKAGQKGLTPEEAATLLQAWQTNRAYQDVVGDAKVRRVLDYWNREVVEALGHPDVDGPAVMKHESPAKQMRAVIESVTAKVTQRVEAPLRAEIAARDERIAAQEQRIQSLLVERGNLSSQARAAEAATPDRPGLPAGTPRDLPRTAEEIRAMSADEFFKSGTADRLLRAIPSTTGQRRRAG